MKVLYILLTAVLPVFSPQFIILFYNWIFFLLSDYNWFCFFFFWVSPVSEHSLLDYSTGNPSLFVGLFLLLTVNFQEFCKLKILTGFWVWVFFFVMAYSHYLNSYNTVSLLALAESQNVSLNVNTKNIMKDSLSQLNRRSITLISRKQSLGVKPEDDTQHYINIGICRYVSSWKKGAYFTIDFLQSCFLVSSINYPDLDTLILSDGVMHNHLFTFVLDLKVSGHVQNRAEKLEKKMRNLTLKWLNEDSDLDRITGKNV